MQNEYFINILKYTKINIYIYNIPINIGIYNLLLKYINK